MAFVSPAPCAPRKPDGALVIAFLVLFMRFLCYVARQALFRAMTTDYRLQEMPPYFVATSTIAGVQRKGHIFWNQGFSSLFYVLHASYVCDLMSLQEQSCGVPSQHVL